MSAKNNENATPVNEPVNEASSQGEGEAAEELKKIDKYARGGDHPIIGLIVFTVLQFVALLLVVVATPIGMFEINPTWKAKLYGLPASGSNICVTAWGMRNGCGSTGYYNRDFTHTFCYRVRVNFKIVESFCIMTIGFMMIGLVMGVLAIFQKVGKGATGAIGAFGMVLCIIPWGVVAGMYHQKPCCETNGWNTDAKTTVCTGNNTRLTEDVPPFKTMGKFGAGFGLLVAAWAIEVIAVVFAFAPL